jgi:hypothetical protein
MAQLSPICNPRPYQAGRATNSRAGLEFIAELFVKNWHPQVRRTWGPKYNFAESTCSDRIHYSSSPINRINSIALLLATTPSRNL